MESLTAEQALEEAKGLTFEKIWMTLMETRRQIESQIEASRQQTKEQIEASRQQTKEQIETSRQQTKEQIEASNQRSEREMADFRKQLAGLGVSVGQQTEAMFSNLCTKFETFGYEFTGQAPRYKFYDGKRVIAEADYLLENGKYIMAVEVKTKLTEEDINDHIQRIAIIRQHKDAHGDKRKIIGAVAGGIGSDSVLAYAQKNGFYVLVQSGESVMIANLPNGFKAREW